MSNNYVNTTSNNENDNNFSGAILDTNESIKETKPPKQVKKISQSCTMSEKSKMNQKSPAAQEKTRPFKRIEKDLISNKEKLSEVNNSNIINNSLKIEREVEVSITTSKSGRKNNQLNIVSRDSKEQAQNNSQNLKGNPLRESEFLNKTEETIDINERIATLSNVNESLDKKVKISDSKRKTLNDSLQQSKLDSAAKRKKILEYDKSLKNPLILNEKTKYKPVFTEESLIENKKKIKKPPEHPNSTSNKHSKKEKVVIEISEEELHNNRLKLLEAYEARALIETKKQLINDTNKINKKNEKKIRCLKDKNLFENVLNTSKSNDENEMNEAKEFNEADVINEGVFETEMDNLSLQHHKTPKQNKVATTGENKNQTINNVIVESFDNSRIINPSVPKTPLETGRGIDKLQFQAQSLKPKPKEKVDPNEYMKKIYENIEEHFEPENSFRKSFSQKVRKRDESANMSRDHKAENHTRLMTEYNTSDAPKAPKKVFPENYKEELKYFINEKKKQLKENKVREENEKTEKALKIYYSLHNITEKIKEDNKKKPKYLSCSNRKKKKLVENDQYIGHKPRNNINNAYESANSSKIDQANYLTQVYDFLKTNLNPKVTNLNIKVKEHNDMIHKGEEEMNLNMYIGSINSKIIEKTTGGIATAMNSSTRLQVKARDDKIKNTTNNDRNIDRIKEYQQNPTNPNQTKKEKNEKKENDDKRDEKNNPSNKGIKKIEKYESHEKFINLMDEQKKQQSIRTLESADIESHKSQNVEVQNLKCDESKKQIHNSKLNNSPKIVTNSNNRNNVVVGIDIDLIKKVEDVKNRYKNLNENNINASNASDPKSIKEKIKTIKTDQNNINNLAEEDANINNNNLNNNINKKEENVDDNEEMEGTDEDEIEEEFIYNQAARFIQEFIRENYYRRNQNQEEQGEIDDNQDDEENGDEMDDMDYEGNFENPGDEPAEGGEGGESEDQNHHEDHNPDEDVYENQDHNDEKENNNYQKYENQNLSQNMDGVDFEMFSFERMDNKNLQTQNNNNEDCDKDERTEYLLSFNNDFNKGKSEMSITPPNNTGRLSNKTNKEKIEYLDDSNECDISLKNIINPKNIINIIKIDTEAKNKSGGRKVVSYNELADSLEDPLLQTPKEESNRKSLSQQLSSASIKSIKSRVVYSVLQASSSKNSCLLISPNSADSHRLHRLKELIKKQKDSEIEHEQSFNNLCQHVKGTSYEKYNKHVEDHDDNQNLSYISDLAGTEAKHEKVNNISSLSNPIQENLAVNKVERANSSINAALNDSKNSNAVNTVRIFNDVKSSVNPTSHLDKDKDKNSSSNSYSIGKTEKTDKSDLSPFSKAAASPNNIENIEEAQLNVFDNDVNEVTLKKSSKLDHFGELSKQVKQNFSGWDINKVDKVYNEVKNPQKPTFLPPSYNNSSGRTNSPHKDKALNSNESRNNRSEKKYSDIEDKEINLYNVTSGDIDIDWQFLKRSNRSSGIDKEKSPDKDEKKVSSILYPLPITNFTESITNFYNDIDERKESSQNINHIDNNDPKNSTESIYSKDDFLAKSIYVNENEDDILNIIKQNPTSETSKSNNNNINGNNNFCSNYTEDNNNLNNDIENEFNVSINNIASPFFDPNVQNDGKTSTPLFIDYDEDKDENNLFMKGNRIIDNKINQLSSLKINEDIHSEQLITLDRETKTIHSNNSNRVTSFDSNLLSDNISKKEKEPISRFNILEEPQQQIPGFIQSDTVRDVRDKKAKYADLITDFIMDCIFNKEIFISGNLIPQKNFKAMSITNQLNESTNSLTNFNSSKSLIQNGQNSSVVSPNIIPTILDDKREYANKFYNEKLATNLIDTIVKEIGENYENIYSLLKEPYYHNNVEILHSILMKDTIKTKSNFRLLPNEIKPAYKEKEGYVSKKKVLEEFGKYNIKERSIYFPEHLQYDSIYNECLFDAALEILEQERYYGLNGVPLAWSSRPRTINYKYSQNEMSKQKLMKKMQKELKTTHNYKLGMIIENNEMEQETLNAEREKRMIVSIKKELNDKENWWKNFELEDTKVKIELSEMVLEQLINEVVEIFEHIHLSRKRPHLYQNKSIFSCEDIPRLGFQVVSDNNLFQNINLFTKEKDFAREKEKDITNYDNIH